MLPGEGAWEKELLPPHSRGLGAQHSRHGSVAALAAGSEEPELNRDVGEFLLRVRDGEIRGNCQAGNVRDGGTRLF